MLKKIWITIFCTVFLWSAINPYDYFTWILEVTPAFIALVVLWKTERTFPLTKLAYILILIHCIILMIGGHYTYSEVPFFNTLKDTFELTRNNYDKLGHFAQGFVPAIVIREIFIRKNLINSKKWENFLVIMFCLGFSGFYELLEWWSAIAFGNSTDAFLGTQGYVWDTQSDMGYALLGAILALVTLSKLHNKQIDRNNT